MDGWFFFITVLRRGLILKPVGIPYASLKICAKDFEKALCLRDQHVFM